MKHYKTLIILFNLVVLLVFFNFSLLEKEKTLTEGKLVLLELAPTDPRSLMQGDYMTLRYTIANIGGDSLGKNGYCVLALDTLGVAQLVRTQAQKTPLAAPSELLIAYKNQYNTLSIGAESFFFEEGQADKFAAARYGALRIDGKGNSILVGLYNDKRELIR
jgi:uncharacterized membrane-anchored protein